MATEKTITVTTWPGSKVEIEASGFPDATCLKETEELEKSLGAVTKRTKKVEADKIHVGSGKVTVGSKK